MRIKKEQVKHTEVENDQAKKLAESLDAYLVKKGIPSDSFIIDYSEDSIRLNPRTEKFWLSFTDTIVDKSPLEYSFVLNIPRKYFRIFKIRDVVGVDDNVSPKPLTFYNRLKSWSDRVISK